MQTNDSIVSDSSIEPTVHGRMRPPRDPRAIAVLLGFCMLVSLSYAGTFGSTLESWLDYKGHYGHGLIVLALVAYSLWRDQSELTQSPLNRGNYYLFMTLLLGASGVWFVSILAGVQIPGVFATLAVLWLGLSILLGQGSLLRLAPYMFLLILSIPVWQPILNPPLQAIATNVTNGVLSLMGLRIYMEGNTITMPDVVFEVVGGCSGLGYLLVSLILSIYLALEERLRLGAAVGLVLFFAGLALFSNWLRITLIMLFGYFEGPEHPLVNDHLWFGWVVFCCLFFPAFIWLPQKFARFARTPLTRASAFKHSATTLGSLLALVILLPVLSVVVNYIASKDALAHAPLQIDPVQFSSTSDASSWAPEFSQASFNQLITVSRPDESRSATIFQAGYANQTEGAELISEENKLNPEGWLLRHRQDVETPYGSARTAILQSDFSGHQWLLWYWYRVGEHVVTSKIEAKVAQVLSKLQFDGRASVVAIATPCDSNCERAASYLSEVVNSFEG